ncbi:hypothetical protein HYW99_03550 [Candidatus Woesearchaeota archaeon]|nr:hypothetical protein [Candidatus Woesearchaeota archaeon]
MPEIRFTITKKLNDILLGIAGTMGVDKSEYIKSLILTDIRKKQIQMRK